MKYLKLEESINKQLSSDGQARSVADTELLPSTAFGKKASLEAELHHMVGSRIDELRTKPSQLEQSKSQSKAKQVEQDDIEQALEEQLEAIKSAPMQEDEDLK